MLAILHGERASNDEFGARSLQGSSKTLKAVGVRYRSIVSRVALGGSMDLDVGERNEARENERLRQVSSEIARGG